MIHTIIAALILQKNYRSRYEGEYYYLSEDVLAVSGRKSVFFEKEIRMGKLLAIMILWALRSLRD